MGRPRGTRNPRFDARRAELITKLLARLMTPDAARVSFRELAAAAGVSIATLRHYFGSREGAIQAVLEVCHQQGLPHLHAVAAGPLAPVRESLRWFLDYASEGLVRHGVGAIHELGLLAGLRDEQLGPVYLDHVLEPTLQALEARLARHVAAGELRACDTRVAAIELVSPLLVAVLHQTSLGGQRCRPLDLPAFLEAHLDAFLRSYATAAAARGRRSSAK